MPNTRPTLAIVVLIGLLLAVGLAGCSSDTQPTPAPQLAAPTATRPIIVTQIVTPLPTDTPSPTPTLAYDLSPVGGQWLMNFEIDIDKNGFVDRLRYDGYLTLTVESNGSITGSGSFTPNLFDSQCTPHVLDQSSIGFSVTGSTAPQDDQIWAMLQIVPDDPGRIENYGAICTGYNDQRYLRQSILWPTLSALNRLNWRFALQNNQTFTFDGDLTQLTNAMINGQLSATVRLSRG